MHYELVKNMKQAKFWGNHKHESRKQGKNRKKAEADTFVCPWCNECIYSSVCCKHKKNYLTYRKAELWVAPV